MEEKLFHCENKNVSRLTQQIKSFQQISFASNRLSGIFFVQFFLVYFLNNIHEV